MFIARADALPVGIGPNLGRGCGIRSRMVTQFVVPIAAPAPERAVFFNRAGMIIARPRQTPSWCRSRPGSWRIGCCDCCYCRVASLRYLPSTKWCRRFRARNCNNHLLRPGPGSQSTHPLGGRAVIKGAVPQLTVSIGAKAPQVMVLLDCAHMLNARAHLHPAMVSPDLGRNGAVEIGRSVGGHQVAPVIIGQRRPAPERAVIFDRATDLFAGGN